MAIVLIWICKGIFFDLVHVSNTTSLSLKKAIFDVLLRHDLNGYDGASNMCGEWSGLQALGSNECPYAYYIYCFAHRLQLALVAASRDLTIVVSIVGFSYKRHDQLQANQVAEIERIVSIDELETGKGLNQIGTLKQFRDTRWSFHLSSLRKNIIFDATTYAQRGDSDAAYDAVTSFEFVFILHIMIDIMEITHDPCQALQCKSQYIVNVMHLDLLFEKVKSFCEKHGIDGLDMNAPYTSSRGRSHLQKDPITMEHHFHVDMFYAIIDSQLQALNGNLDPRDDYKSFNIDNICTLVERFYPEDFSEKEKLHLRCQLVHFELDIRRHTTLQNFSLLHKLC
ncbi:zinc finger MYM-type protein 1-like [Gossypium australe]|uniref:Zinc finger MYM-type protein 1-like n=1 Tax=Gossypium australe TaxID=47621 RepID=A0A5B6VCG0_9ROSI|nr:zinc finger MYM-type protein 1-like [Gossypium australe]